MNPMIRYRGRIQLALSTLLVAGLAGSCAVVSGRAQEPSRLVASHSVRCPAGFNAYSEPMFTYAGSTRVWWCSSRTRAQGGDVYAGNGYVRSGGDWIPSP
jgi:hypothetical protein